MRSALEPKHLSRCLYVIPRTCVQEFVLVYYEHPTEGALLLEYIARAIAQARMRVSMHACLWWDWDCHAPKATIIMQSMEVKVVALKAKS